MGRVWMMLYGAVGAAMFLFTMLYAAGIAGNLLQSRPLDGGVRGGGRLLESIRIDTRGGPQSPGGWGLRLDAASSFQAARRLRAVEA